MRETYRPARLQPHVIVISFVSFSLEDGTRPGVGGVLVPVSLGQFSGFLIFLTCTTAPGYFVIEIHKFGDRGD